MMDKNNNEELSPLDRARAIVDQMFSGQQSPQLLDPKRDLVDFDFENYGNVAISVTNIEVVQEGMRIDAIFDLENQAGSLGRFNVRLDSENLEVDASASNRQEDYPYESGSVINQAILEHCKVHGIAPPLTEEVMSIWINESFGEKFSLGKSGDEYQLISDRGIWAHSSEMKLIVNRVEKSLINDDQFLREVAVSIPSPVGLHSGDGDLVTRERAYALEKVSSALKGRPDQFQTDSLEIFSEKISKENERKSKPSFGA